MGEACGSAVEPDAACGLKIGVTYASIQETTEVPAKSDACVAAGLSPIDKVIFTRQDDLTAALIAGEVEAMSADSPVTGFTVKLSAGEFDTAGPIFDLAPYGWPVAKEFGVGGADAPGAGASDEDRRVPDHRHDVGRREGHHSIRR